MLADLEAIRLPLFKFTLTDKGVPEDEALLREWRNETLHVVHRLQAVLNVANLPKLTPDELAHIFSILHSLKNSEEWMNQDITKVVTEILERLPPSNFEVVRLTIFNHIKPSFSKTPHTRIDTRTGRSTRRPAGGPSGTLDFFEGQEWKQRPGLSSLIIWCIKCLKGDEYEQVWHLIVPPSMTFIDDYESYYKLKGVEIISEFIDQAPVELLKRTGIDGLIRTSLGNALLQLHSPLTPGIMQVTIPVFTRLIKMTTSPGSIQRFDQLCALLGEGIIGSVWIYAYQDFETIEVSLLASCEVVEELGIGTTRYIKTIVPQLVQFLSMSGGMHISRIQIAALKLLSAVLAVCRPRIHAWSEMILDGVLRCWVSLHDQDGPVNEELSTLLIQIVDELFISVPSAKAHCENLINLDKPMFAPLFRMLSQLEDHICCVNMRISITK